MNILIRNAQIIDPQGEHHGHTKDILIHNGVIKEIGTQISKDPDTEELAKPNILVFPGLIELHSSLPEPGHEERETIASGLQAAAKGGFTHVVAMPDSHPITDHRGQMAFRSHMAQGFLTRWLPTGAVTQNSQGKELAEMYDMWQGGAVAFSDYKKPFENSMLLRLALEYTKQWNTPLMINAFDAHLAQGQMHEGHQQTLLGLKPLPALAELLGVQKALALAEYTGGRLHLCSISTGQTIDLIASAKARGVRVTADVNIHHLTYLDEHLAGFDSHYKVFPPLRDKGIVAALKQALRDEVIDALAVDHIPCDIEQKSCEFDRAAFGMAGFETALGMALRSGLPRERVIGWLTRGPERVLGMAPRHLAVGQSADLVVWDPHHTEAFQAANALTKAVNHPEWGQVTEGKVLLTLRGKQAYRG
jgi:dihydroorotase